MEIKKTACPYDCPDRCGLIVYIENGRVVKVKGDTAHSFTRGMLCPKMAHYERTVYSSRRLTTPLKRSGKKGEGKFIPISWSEAINIIAAKFKETIKKYGSEAILPYSYAGTMGIVQHDAGYYFFNRLGATNLTRGICAPAKGHGYREVMGDTLPTAPQEAGSSDFIILWGLNMLSTDIHFRLDTDMARANGATVYAIDTYSSPSTRYADKFIAIKPGTDGALALGIMHIIAHNNLADENFIARYVTGWDKLKAEILPNYPPNVVAKITNVKTKIIVDLAKKYAKARAPFIRLGSGLSRYGNGAMSVRLITCLPAIVGAYNHVGGGLLTSTSGSHAFDKNIIRRPDVQQKNSRTLSMIELGSILNDKNLEPPIKALYVYSSNPACTAPDQNAVIEGLKREDLFTVVHERFMTDTALFADIILPATTSLEHNDIYYSYGHYTIQQGNKIIEPIGESKSNWNTFGELARAMGVADDFYTQDEHSIIEKLVGSINDTWSSPINVKKLTNCEPVDLPLPHNYKLNFATPSKKIELFNPKTIPNLPDYFPPYYEKDSEEFILINAPDPRILDSSFNEREEFTTRHVMELLINPADAARLNIIDGDEVIASNSSGKAIFTAKISADAAANSVVTLGVWWREFAKGNNSVNALTYQRSTDKACGSTFYDVKVNICKSLSVKE